MNSPGVGYRREPMEFSFSGGDFGVSVIAPVGSSSASEKPCVSLFTDLPLNIDAFPPISPAVRHLCTCQAICDLQCSLIKPVLNE